MATMDLSGLAAYAGTRSPALILQVLLGLTASQDLTLYQGIKSKQQLTKLTTETVAKPFASDFTATKAGFKFSDREIQTQLGKGEWLIDPNEFFKTWLEQLMPAGVAQPKKEFVPWSTYVFTQLMNQLATDVDLRTVWNGVYNPTGTTAADIATGFGTILRAEIAAGKLIANITGSLATDAVSKVEALYKAHDSKYRDIPMYAFMSWANYDRYCEDYRAKYGRDTITDTFLQKAIMHSNGKCFLKPVKWLGTSERVLITPKENMIIGTDRESDMHQVKTLERMWKLEVGASFNIGFQFRDLEVLQTNDVE